MNIGFRSGKDRRASWVVAYDPDTLVQIGSVEFTLHEGRCLLNDMYVAPDLRQRGVGTRLIEAVLENARVPYTELRWGIHPNIDSVALKRAFDRKFRRPHE